MSDHDEAHMVIGMARARILPGKHAQLAEVARALRAEAAGEDGCLRYETFIDGDALLIMDQWRDQSALDAHLRAPHLAQYAPLLKDGVLDGRLDVQIITAAGVRTLQL